MLFNSYEFLFAFLPVTLAGFYLLRTRHAEAAVWWLVACSLFFYGYWKIEYLGLLVGSIVVNHLLGRALVAHHRRWLLVLGIAANLGVLAYFKYALFVVGAVAGEEQVPEFVRGIVLPLAISFFTFEQISYLIDIWRRNTGAGRWSAYGLFVTLFPHLIAGPIVRYSQLAPQIAAIGRARRAIPRSALPGLILLVIGLFKKVVLADSLAPIATGVFTFADRATYVGFIDAWMGALAYTFQLYFDFSGYSDMAIGLALMVGLRLPINFFSPYKATSIIEFWRRWHISLSAFFRDYVYIPLGGSRRGPFRQYFNLLAVMTLVGIWHGAGWTFLLWGAYHGVLLTLAHLWRAARSGTLGAVRFPTESALSVRRRATTIPRLIGWGVTFFLIVVGWVLFRAESLYIARQVYEGMAFEHGWRASGLALIDSRLYWVGAAVIALSFVICLALPNSMELIRRLHRVYSADAYLAARGARPSRLAWRLSPLYALLLGGIAYLALTTMTNVSTEFLYFNF